MTEAYKVSVELELEDKFTAKLKEIAKKLKEAGETVGKAGDGLKKYSEGGNSFVDMLKKTADSLTALGVNEGLKAAVSSFDRMAAASASIAANMRAAQEDARRMGGATFHGQRHNKLSHPSGSVTSPTAEEAAGIAHEARNPKGEASALKSALKEFGAELAKEIGSKVAESARDALKDGVKKNADLEDVNKRTVQYMDVSKDERKGAMTWLSDLESGYLKNYSEATHGEKEPFAIAIQNASKVLAGKTPEQQKEMHEKLDATMPVAAYHTKMGDKELPEVTESFLKLGEGAQAEGIEKYKELIEATSAAVHELKMSDASGVADDAILASDALKNASGNYSSFMMLMATLRKSGAIDTESGHLIDAMATDALPADMKNPADKKRIEAGKYLGLYDEKGQAKFYGTDGKIDVGKELSIIAKAALESKKNPGKSKEFNQELQIVLAGKGEQGKNIAEFISRRNDNELEDIAAVSDNAEKAKKKGSDFRQDFKEQVTTNDRLDKLKGNLNMSVMNSTVALTGPINLVLDKATGFSGWLEKFTKDHPNISLTVLGAAVGAGYLGKASGLQKLFGAGGKIGAAAEGAEIATAGAEAEGVAAIGVEAVAGAEGLVALGAALGPVILGIAALAGVTAGMGWLLTNVVDPDTDAKNHPGKRRYHRRGQADEWRTDESLPQEHAGQHWLRAGRSGGWVPDAPDSLDANKLKSAEVPSILQTIFGGNGGYVATGRSRSGLPRGTPPATLPDKSLPAPPIPPKHAEPAASEGKAKMQEILDNINRDIEKADKINVSVFVDGKEIASHMVTSNSNGGSGFNSAATRPTPSTSAYGMDK